jgi:carbon monoxide dehydrogenase subunit G
VSGRLVRLGAVGALAAIGAGAAVAFDRLLARMRDGAIPPVETWVVVDSPPEAVWRELADVANQPRWMTDLKSVELLDPGPVGAGTRAVGLVRILGVPVSDPVTVTAFEPPRRFGIRHDGRFHGDGDITLEPGADGRSTLVRWRERLVPPVLPHLGSWLASPVLREVFQADLHRLRRLLEEPAAAG